LHFWFGEGDDYGKAHQRWFEKNDAFDAEVTRRYRALHQEMREGRHRDWLNDARTCLARIIVLDQFPRHIYRGKAAAFSTDAQALEAARHLVAQGWDRGMLPVERMFAYLPFEHSEALADQDRAVELCAPWARSPRPPRCRATPRRTASSCAASAAFPTATRRSAAPARRKRSSS
jgi:uncharacterized protein (DUF924 family)